MANKKVYIAVVIIVIVVGGGIGLYYAFGPKPEAPPPGPTFIYGTSSGPVDLDPQFAWDSASIDVIDQVCEGLFAYDLTDPDLAIISRLAADAGTFTTDAMNFTVTLKPHVWFHDGTNLTAAVVVKSFDRLAFFMNETGELSASVGITQIASLYQYIDDNGDPQPIINKTVAVDDLTVKFVLNTPYVPFKALLCFSGSYIMSPNAPQTRYYSVTSDKLVGTGPFRYISYKTDDQVTLYRWDFYYGGPAKLAQVIFDVIEDATTRNQALLSGDVSYLQDPLPSFKSQFLLANATVTYMEGGLNLIIQYLGFNNVLINATYRQAMSYAFNYSYVLDEIMNGQAVKLNSCIPAGILYANNSFDAPYYNVTKAREIMQSIGLGTGFTTDAEWTGAAAGAHPLATFNYTYNLGNQVRNDIGYLLANNSAAIGIKINVIGVTWEEFLARLYDVAPNSRNDLETYFVGWAPDYNDPSNFVNPLFSNTSDSNGAQVDDPYLNALMVAGLKETNAALREGIYATLQKYMVEQLNPWIFVYQGKNADAWLKTVTGIQMNAMGKVWFYPVNVA